MTILIPDPRLEAPQTGIDVAPVGNLTIDWSNPLTRGLTQAFVFNDAHRCKELVSGRFCEYRVKTRDTLKVYAEKDIYVGRVYYFGSQQHNDFVFDGEAAYEDADNVSFAVGIKVLSNNKNFYVQSSSARDYLGVHTSGNIKAYISDASGSFRLNWQIPLQISHGASNIVLTRDEGVNCSAYRNGVYEAPTIGDSSLGSLKASCPSNGAILSGEGYSGGGMYSYYYCWGKRTKAINEEEATSLNNNPYQFIIPA